MPSPNPNRSTDPKATRLTQNPKGEISQAAPSRNATGPYVPAPLPECPSIDGYAITAPIAKGGMGCVFAGHDLTLDRPVAIKTLLPGANAKRFVSEAKITARLPHPNIPPVYALGKLDDGTPWLAMKLIRGLTLEKLLSQRNSVDGGLPRYLQVFEQIAQAVGFAHSQGIVHRDLKPLNIMVGEFGEVQVMDWGLAKDISSHNETPNHSDSVEGNVHVTRAGAVLGTPGYMAPEQARGEPVDARSDVFALGAILAAILTGKPAFVGNTVKETITKAATADLQDVLARLAVSGAEAELIALARRCLSAEPADRPADGQQVATEVAAYQARVQSRLQQAEKERATAEVRIAETRKRQRAWLVAGGLIAAVLLAGMAGTLWGLSEANRARDAEKLRADAEAEARQTAVYERDAKETALKQAEASLALATKGNEILGSVFAGLNPSANYATVGEMREAFKANLHKAVLLLNDPVFSDSMVVAQMQNTLGLSLLGLGEAKSAVELFEKGRATTLAKLGPRHLNTLTIMGNLAMAYRAAGRLDLALPLYEEAFRLSEASLGPDHYYTLVSMNNLATIYRVQGKFELAMPLYEKTLKYRQRQHGADHPFTLNSMNNLGACYRAMGKLDLALPLLQENLRLTVAKFGPDHPDVVDGMINLALAYQDAGKVELAVPHFENALRIAQAKLGPNHPTTFIGLTNLAQAYRAAKKLTLAVPLYEEMLRLRQAKLGRESSDALAHMNLLGVAYCDTQQGAKASALFQEFTAIQRKLHPPDSPDFAALLARVSLDLLKCEQFQAAEPLLRESLAIRLKKEPQDWTTFNTQSMLGGVLLSQKNYMAAEPLLLQGYEGMKAREKAIPREASGRLPEALDRLIALYTELEQAGVAAKYRQLRAAYPPAKPLKK